MPVKKLPPIDEGPNTARIPKRSKYSLGPEDRDPEAVRLQLEAQHIHTASLSSTANRVSFDNSTMLGRAKESGFISLGQTVSEHRTERDAPSASPEKSPAGAFNRTNFQLTPSESYVAAHKDAVAERWRSLLLKLETDMRELVADGVGEPPASSRIMRVIAHFDEFCRTAEGQSSHLADLLRLFRVEFCRAIFSSHHLGMVDDADSDPEVTAYFDQVTTLLRENAMLSSEVALGNTREKAVELAKQVDRLNANVKLYENEIGRLVRLNDHMIEQLRKSKEELDAAKAAAEAKIAANERELQALNVENKDMQLQLFRLRKQVAGGKAKILKDSYQHMKLTKMSLMTTLFSEGDERIGLLVMLSQLESRVNEILDSYDNEYMLSAENAHTDLRRKMANSVAVLLEEMHLCEKNYRRLVPGALSYRTTSEEMDETDGFAAILFDQKIYESFLLRESIRKRLANGGVNVTGIKPYQPISTGEDSGRRGEDGKKGGEERDREMSGTHMAAGGGDLNNSTSLLSQPAAKRKLSLSTSRSAVLPAPFSLPSSGSAAEKLPAVTTERSASMGADMEEIVFMKKNEWIENVFNMSPAEELLKRLLVNVKAEHIVPDKILPNLMMPRLLRHPMHDLSSDKFLWGVDLFAGRDPAIQKFLCTLNYIDPSVPIQLPESSNFLKVKYKSSLHGEHHHEKQVTQQSPLPQPPTQASTHSPLSHRDSYSGFSPPPKPSISLSGTMRQQSPNLRKETPATVKTRPLSVNRALADWGGRTLFGEEKIKDDAEDKKLFNVGENLRVFKELNNPALLKENSSSQQRAGATNSTTAFTVALQRLNPMSPNRAPEWTLYKSLFGGYRALTPRMIEMSTIDHILLNACKGHFTRMEYRYDQCLSEANFRATNNQMAYSIAERFFRENYELTDFQEALVDELEARYGYPELVAKNLYELLCYLDAMGKKDALMNLYLNVIRGFQPPTHIHYICNQLYHLSYCWPCSNPLDEVTREDALTVLRYLYRNTETIVHVDIHEILKDFDMATRNAALTFITMREFLANFMLHQEEPLLLYFNGMFSNLCESDNLQEITFENYDQVISRFWKHREERKSLVRFLAAGLGFNRGPLLSTRDLSFVASSALSSELLS